MVIMKIEIINLYRDLLKTVKKLPASQSQDFKMKIKEEFITGRTILNEKERENSISKGKDRLAFLRMITPKGHIVGQSDHFRKVYRDESTRSKDGARKPVTNWTVSTKKRAKQ